MKYDTILYYLFIDFVNLNYLLPRIFTTLLTGTGSTVYECKMCHESIILLSTASYLLLTLLYLLNLRLSVIGCLVYHAINFIFVTIAFLATYFMAILYRFAVHGGHLWWWRWHMVGSMFFFTPKSDSTP